MTVDARQPIVRAGNVASFAKIGEPMMFALERVARRIQRARGLDNDRVRAAIRDSLRRAAR